jgi:hemolysin activation/secretion protein
MLAEFFRELFMLLITPGLIERIELSGNGPQSRLEIVVKFSQHPRESPQLGRIDDGL